MTTYLTTAQLRDVDEIRDASRRAGSHFFDPATMRAFGSRLLDVCHPAAGGGRSYFVTSERDRVYSGWGAGAWGGQRRYTVRVIAWAAPQTIDEPTGGAGFGGYRSRSGAVAAARRFALADTGGPAAWPCPLELHDKYAQAEPIPGEPDACRGCLEDAAHRIREDNPAPLTAEELRQAAAILRAAGHTVDTRYNPSAWLPTT